MYDFIDKSIIYYPDNDKLSGIFFLYWENA